MLDNLERLLDRTKVLYEQYFMGIQKIPPAQLHRDIERKVRELTQEQIRNTALRFRFTNLTQKFGSYNTYWKRTLQSIEQGRYNRHLVRAQQRARRNGQELPEEIVAAMPKRMRDRIRRDREMIAKRKQRAESEEAVVSEQAFLSDDIDGDIDAILGELREFGESQPSPVQSQGQKSTHSIDAGDDLLLNDSLDKIFENLTTSAEQAVSQLEVSAPTTEAANKSRTNQPEQTWATPTPSASTSIPAATPNPTLQAVGTHQAHNTAGRTAKDGVTDSPARPLRPATAKRAAERAAARQEGALPPPPGMTEAQTRSLYQQYVQARKQLGNGSNISYDRLKRKLHAQAPRLMEQYRTDGIQYNVVIKNDKVVLKATPKQRSS